MVNASAVGSLGSAGRGKGTMLTTGQAAGILGLSPDQVRRLSLEPDRTYVSTHHVRCALYARDRIVGLHDDPRVAAARRRRRGPTRWDETFERTYGAPEAAARDAAGAMFELNRYAKRAKWETRERIYRLKDRLIRRLHELGHCTAVHRHSAEPTKRRCWRCDGMGCGRCGHTGLWSEARALHFLCFTFEIEGQRFRWHQPLSQARWVPRGAIADEPEADWQPGGVVEARWPEMGFAKAYALVEWMIGPGRDKRQRRDA